MSGPTPQIAGHSQRGNVMLADLRPKHRVQLVNRLPMRGPSTGLQLRSQAIVSAEKGGPVHGYLLKALPKRKKQCKTGISGLCMLLCNYCRRLQLLPNCLRMSSPREVAKLPVHASQSSAAFASRPKSYLKMSYSCWKRFDKSRPKKTETQTN